MAEKPVYGGHECELVQEVSDRLNCQICTKVLRDPHLAVCCGQHFCESCLNKWFTRQDKESCPHCRAEGEAFHHVIDKSVRRAVNELKIRCSNHGEGCQWAGELGELNKHLESDDGCGFVMVECPNKCFTFGGIIVVMKRKDVHDHLTNFCYLRAYQCEFCGLKDTYEAITGNDYVVCIKVVGDDYFGHQAECPEVPLTCPNKCGADKIKRKNMKSHHSQCPQEPVECPFAEAGCSDDIRRHQLASHMTTSLQQHLILLTIDYKQLKVDHNQLTGEFCEVKAKLSKAETELTETKLQLYEAEARLTFSEDLGNSANKLKKMGDSVKFTMPKFSEYRRSRKVWHSPPFYYREGYKMCLEVDANGVGEGAGTHVSVAILHLKGAYDDQFKWPMKSCFSHGYVIGTMSCIREGDYQFCVCCSLQHQQVNEHEQVDYYNEFCSLNSKALHLVNDCLTFNVEFNLCYLKVTLC